VPRVWEKVIEKMLKKAKDIKGIEKTVSTKAKLTGLKYHKTVEGEGAYNFFKKIYFSGVKAFRLQDRQPGVPLHSGQGEGTHHHLSHTREGH
jgi:hypothetical protein